jgi:hypothetical protein
MSKSKLLNACFANQHLVKNQALKLTSEMFMKKWNLSNIFWNKSKSLQAQGSSS